MGVIILKLQTIVDLDNQIKNLQCLSNTFKDYYIHELDDDLWTIDMEVTPVWCEKGKYDISFITIKPLKKKYIIRFCEEYGLNLKYYEECDRGFLYVFKLEDDDIIRNIEKFNL